MKRRSEKNDFDLLLVVHGVQGSIGLSISRKAHEAESTTAQSCAILDDDLYILGLGSASFNLGEEKGCGALGRADNTDSFLDLAELLESLAESIIISVPRKAASWRKMFH
jgi:hypothetical protein